jgi:hypothetical protein
VVHDRDVARVAMRRALPGGSLFSYPGLRSGRPLVSSSGPIRWGGPAAILSGVLFVINGLLTVTSPRTPFLSLMSTIALLFMLVGLAGLHALQRGRVGIIGLVGFYATIVGVLVQLLGLVGLGLLVMEGALVILVGLALYGVDTARARVLPLWCGMLLIATLFIAIPLGPYTNVWFGLVWLALGYVLWLHRGTTPGQPSRVR